MPHFILIFRQLLSLVKKGNFHWILMALITLMATGTGAMVYFEKDMQVGDAAWWTIVTMTTVGYGDISPATAGGRIAAVFVMLVGIGILGLFTAAVAGFIVENKLMEARGMKPVKAQNSILICGWNYRVMEMISEFRDDPKSRTRPIVILADLEENPVVSVPDTWFVRGDVSPETLKSAGIEGASVAMVLSGDNRDAYACDAKTILATMTIKHMRPDLYTCVELSDPANIGHCEMAKANEIIVAGELTANLLVQAALDHGITRLITELVTNRYGSDLYKIPCPEKWRGIQFLDVLTALKKEHNALLIGIEARGGALFTNPSPDFTIPEDSALIVISENRPSVSSP